jgi:hypothetical protein
VSGEDAADAGGSGEEVAHQVAAEVHGEQRPRPVVSPPPPDRRNHPVDYVDYLGCLGFDRRFDREKLLSLGRAGWAAPPALGKP